MNITVKQTLERPDIVLFMREIEAALEQEKERRKHFYEVIDENKKMEFINGEIYFQSPVKAEHNRATLNLAGLLNVFVTRNELGFLGIEKILVSLSRNDYEPDICFFGADKAIEISPKQMQFPAPDLAIEVLSDSTERHDRETKFQDYAAHGVKEYWIIDADAQTVEQYFENDGVYDLVLKSADGHIESKVIAGFRIAIRSIFDDGENLKELRRLLA
jgi:Uma2 family endonuclease